MTIEIKKGDISGFFASAKETAKEIDEGKKVTRKNTIWVESKDLMNLLKPERTKLVTYLRGKKRIVFTDLVNEMNRTAVSLNRDLNLLSKYQLIRIYKEPNPGNRIYFDVTVRFGQKLFIILGQNVIKWMGRPSFGWNRKSPLPRTMASQRYKLRN